jgi:hypothetical protein
MEGPFAAVYACDEISPPGTEVDGNHRSSRGSKQSFVETGLREILFSFLPDLARPPRRRFNDRNPMAAPFYLSNKIMLKR